MRYVITHRDGRTEQVDGDEMAVDASGATVISQDALVIIKPRRIVARRLLASKGATAAETG